MALDVDSANAILFLKNSNSNETSEIFEQFAYYSVSSMSGEGTASKCIFLRHRSGTQLFIDYWAELIFGIFLIFTEHLFWV